MVERKDQARILLVGCGGIGCMAALNLESGGQAQVTAVLRSSYQIVKERGFTINSVDHGRVQGFRPTEILSAVPDVSQSGISPFDYVICATKNTPDVSTPVAELIRPAVTPDVGNAADRAKDLVARYNAGGHCTCHYDSNVTFSRWKKLLYNAVYNPVAALTNLDTGDIQLCPGLVDEIVRPGMKEIQATAAAYGHEITNEMIEATITTEPIEAHVPPMASAAHTTISTFLLTYLQSQYIEFENLVGEPLRCAKARQIATPILQNNYSLAKSYQWKLKSKRAV
ncbi:2-dehydropantoate 2-reductase [Fusarium langsethiae]|uniref:2-dehydropantoate 2-reductase n=1 Tax=Fusarium langsethiae TaxID=179993 RepID=A0A0N1J2M4_FUSLA|nr:2-dehydropantoate 2-reductase [Fusarium langsethiae]